MRPIVARWMAEYAADHRHPMNRLTHKVAIPVIVFHILAMLSWIPLGAGVHGGHVGWLVATGFYLWAHPALGVVLGVLFGLCLPLAAVTPAWAVVALAVVGWTVQLAGHALYEKNRPSFSRNLVQALVGPFFFVAVLTGAWRPAPAEAGA